VDVVLDTLRTEFSDLADPAAFTRIAVRLALAVALAAVVGYERELRGTAAGLRTHMMVGLGVALLVATASESRMEPADVSRVVQGILAGIGFLGAGAIIKQDEKEQVKGLTTAASIWTTAAIATAAGLGREATAILATVLAVIILAVLLHLERHVARRRSASNEDDPSADRGHDPEKDDPAARRGHDRDTR
jgi:putative Mg2+ transporter-C (MgtC) family protein